MKRNHDAVIAVDGNYMPMMEVSRHHAIRALMTERAEVLDLGSWTRLAWFELSSFKEFKCIVYRWAKVIPEIRIRLGRRFSSVLERDRHQCQYCGGKASTVDHVIPKAQGGPTLPSNLVAACWKCNQAKGNRTPEQAGMPLLHTIRSMHWQLFERFQQLVEQAAT